MGTRLALVWCLGLMTACGEAVGPEVAAGDAGDEGAAGPPVPWTVEGFPELPGGGGEGLEARVELGRLLFHDPILSSDGTVACFTCHSPVWGLSDGLPRSIGIGGVGPNGTGRTGPNPTPRNSPSLWNVGYRQSLFWDGRASSLEEQVSSPLANPIELGRDLEAVAADLADIPEYVVRFEEAFPAAADPLAPEHIPAALADFQRTLVSDNAPYDQYASGDAAALSADEVAGLFAFAELECHGCHAAPLFEMERFETSPLDDGDLGRFAVTAQPADRGRFRVPTLRNARETGPYFHDGSVGSLAEAVRLEAEFRAERAVSEEEIERITDFIRYGLMDKSRAPRRPVEVPSGLPVPVDGYQVPR